MLLAEKGLYSPEDVEITTDYLAKHLESWSKDESHVFAMFCALSKLAQLTRRSVDQLAFGMTPVKRRSLVSKIERILPDIKRALVKAEFRNFKPIPQVQGVPLMRAHPFFIPYGKFWRMKRAGFLMYAHLIIEKGGNAWVSVVQNDSSDASLNALMRCFRTCAHLSIKPFPRRASFVNTRKWDAQWVNEIGDYRLSCIRCSRPKPSEP